MFPFSAIVGQEDAKLALMISSVDSSIGGVLLNGVKGTGKSTLVRAFANVLPEIDVSVGCPYHCNPYNPDYMCAECEKKYKSGEIEVVKVKPRVVSVPLGTTEDRLLGSIDVQKILTAGEVSFQQGLIANANRQILYIDEVNLLPDNLTDDILDVVVSGINRVEREGISIEHPAKFVLVGTMNSEEGQLRPQILDRFALSVKIDTIKDPNLRTEIVNRALAYSFDSKKFNKEFDKVDRELAEQISAARENLPKVKISKKLINIVSLAMSELGVDGQRPDIVIVKSAIALAALWGDKKVEIKHIEKVSPLAVCHRTRNGGFDEPPTPEEVLKQIHKASGEISGSSGSEEYTLEQVHMKVMEGVVRAILNSREDSKKKRLELFFKITHPENESIDLRTVARYKRELFAKLNRYLKHLFSRGKRREYIKFNARHSVVVGNSSRGRFFRTIYTDDISNVEILPTIFEELRCGFRKLLPVRKMFWRKYLKIAQPSMMIMLIIDASSSTKSFLYTMSILMMRFFDRYVENRSKVGMVVIENGRAVIKFSPTRNRQLVFGEIARLNSGGFTPLDRALQLAKTELSRQIRINSSLMPYIILVSDCYPEPLPQYIGDAYDTKEYKKVRATADEIGRLKIPIVVIDFSKPAKQIEPYLPGRRLAKYIAKRTNGTFISLPAEQIKISPITPKIIYESMLNSELDKLSKIIGSTFEKNGAFSYFLFK